MRYLLLIFMLFWMGTDSFADKNPIGTKNKEGENAMKSNSAVETLKCPAEIPQTWLDKESHPSVFCSRDELRQAAENIKNTDYGRTYLKQQIAICKYFIGKPDDELRALVPKPGCKIVYGLGMNLCPDGGKLRWGGWFSPFKVTGKDNIVYPNADYPDDGNGVEKGDKTYYFTANANGFIFKELEENVIPALSDVYALSGERRYAHVAAVLLDAVAFTYPSNRRGPMDYPTTVADLDKGGRLQRPYYQVARGLLNYVNSIDLIASSGELEMKSCNPSERSIRENIIRNLLWDGGSYCLDFALKCSQLHNGHADYVRGAALVMTLFDVDQFAQPLLDSRIGINNMLDMNIDRNGFYSEVSPMYSIHTSDLYQSIAEIIYYARIKKMWKNQKSLYSDSIFLNFISEFFSRREVGYHVPLIGDAGPDRIYSPSFEKISSSDNFWKNQINGAWFVLVRAENEVLRQRAAKLLKTVYHDGKVIIPKDRWFIYHVMQSHISLINSQAAENEFNESKSVFYGAKGIALLRGGADGQRYGAQLMFGMQNNHGQKEALTWTFFANGLDFCFDPGYFNTHYRFGWTNQSVSHQSLVVNTKNYDVNDGYGFMKAWLNKPEVQWAFAEHPVAYKSEGATKFQRLIAQIHNPETGSLGYWLDIGMVKGGNSRDDSFHCALKNVDSVNLDFNPIRSFSLYGDAYKGQHFLDNYTLSGFENKSFYWSPPGDGYGFILKPKSVKTEKSLKLVLSKHVFSDLFTGRMIIDFPGERDREYFLAESIGAFNSPSVPYLIRRDSGENKASIFTKVIRFAPDVKSDHIKEVTSINGMKNSSGLLVDWNNGTRDMWIIRDDESNEAIKVKFENLPEIRTDGVLTMIRFNEAGDVIFAYASTATKIEIDERVIVSGKNMFSGRIKNIKNVIDNLIVEVDPAIPQDKSIENLEGMPFVTKSEKSLPATWSIKKISEQKIVLNDLKADMGSADFIACDENNGTFKMPLILSTRFFSAKGQVSPNAIRGKKISIKDNDFVTVSEILDNGQKIRIVDSGGNPFKTDSFRGYIYELAPCDDFFIPLNLYWHRNTP